MDKLKPFRDRLVEELKNVQFKDFVPTNGVKGKNGYVTLHHNARKRISTAILKVIAEELPEIKDKLK